jgi:hypothetical protein
VPTNTDLLKVENQLKHLLDSNPLDIALTQAHLKNNCKKFIGNLGVLTLNIDIVQLQKRAK